MSETRYGWVLLGVAVENGREGALVRLAEEGFDIGGLYTDGGPTFWIDTDDEPTLYGAAEALGRGEGKYVEEGFSFEEQED